MEDSKLFFSLDRHDDGPSVAFSRDKPPTRESRSELSLGIDPDQAGRRSPPPFLPRSPSSPGSLADLSSAGLLAAAANNSGNLVKSSSTELRESSLRGKPLLSLVKSLSTEISRRVEPEVNLSKSDSKLHLHPWRQGAHVRIPEATPGGGGAHDGEEEEEEEEEEDWACGEPRGSSLIAELEDTRRKFSEAMQDPLSMLSKIMREESGGSPKLARGNATAGDSGGRDADEVEPKCRRRTDGVSESPLRRLHKDSAFNSSPSLESPAHLRESPAPCRESPAPCRESPAPCRESNLEICTYEDVIQALQNGSETPRPSRGFPPLPLHWLLPVGLLAYGVLVLPLSSYVTGLSVGVACGFVLGLLVVYVFAPRRSNARSHRAGDGWSRSQRTNTETLDGKAAETLEGWMNETHSYDPETFHPSVTHSVYVSLDGGGRLRLAYPRTAVPRWAGFHHRRHEEEAEPPPPPPREEFLHSRTFHLANCKVSLLPPGLARKRLWNRKYPICVTLPEGEVGEESPAEGERTEEEEQQRTDRRPLPDHQQLPVSLHLFGRTGREKEEWFQHFSAAARGETQSHVTSEESAETPTCGEAPRDAAEELPDLPGATKARTLLDYSLYMAQLIGCESSSPSPSPCPSDRESPSAPKKIHGEELVCGGEAENAGGTGSGGGSAERRPCWVNSLLGRIFWDFLREKYWTDQVAHKIQKKLSKIKLPYFMNELTLADLDMGTCLPQVLSTSAPSLDRRGLWLELEVVYTGCLQMTLETKMNLCKLGKEGEDEAQNLPETQPVGFKPRLCVLADSDEESSSAGSSDEEEAPPSEPQGSTGDKNTVVAADGHTGGSTSRKILRFMDKIAKSKYFQKATENEYIKKKIAEVSNMPLMLSVEVLELSGTLAINIPPPPTDRIWYSFRVPPRLDLHVRPMLGEREVTFSHVTEWIEKKLQCEFQKVLVMPNMDDLYLPLMTSGLDNPPASHASSLHSASHQSSVESQDYMSE